MITVVNSPQNVSAHVGLALGQTVFDWAHRCTDRNTVDALHQRRMSNIFHRRQHNTVKESLLTTIRINIVQKSNEMIIITH